ncbi:MAG: anaerobic ribonucleoside-triphosphate reductase activating protein [Lachnospiraceae bacterium]|nr:anaerobic ribonucleoside-triphosphate reductase activating protein [Lachnospiraceae bacterium]
MNLYGLQKMTLLDFPEHVACTVFLSGCDLRCPYCHNFELACGKAEAVMDEEEFFAFLKKRKGLLDGVAITGGEPCLTKGLLPFMERVKAGGFAVKLDSNGLHPQVLKEAVKNHLVDYIAMDIKNAPSKYAMTTGKDLLDLRPLKESVDLLMEGSTPYEFRTTVVREFHEAEDFHEIGALIKGAKAYFLQQFTDRDSVPFAGLSSPTAEEMGEYLAVVREYVPSAKLRGVEETA